MPSSSAGRTYGPESYHGSDDAPSASGIARFFSSAVFGNRDVRNGENIAGASSLAERDSADASGDEASGDAVEVDSDSESVRESDRVACVCIRGGSRGGTVAALDDGRENQARTCTTSDIRYPTLLADI